MVKEFITAVVGTRPNFIKAGPFCRTMEKHGWKIRLVHSGQHYDENMSEIFFRDLGLPEPDVNLEIGSGSHGRQTGRMLIAFEEEFTTSRPWLVIVFGDVNSTLAATLAAVKMHIPVAHVEAGVRSGDIAMPEEVNRIMVDSISHFLLAPTDRAIGNLRREGRPQAGIHNVGNIMVESLLQLVERLGEPGSLQTTGNRNLEEYAVMTLHRAANTEDARQIHDILEEVSYQVGNRIPVIFPVHPRTRKLLRLDDQKRWANIRFVPPMGYNVFLDLVRCAAIVITDSGGLQVESTILGVPCVTMRKTTEWPETIESGTNVLLGPDIGKLAECMCEARGKAKTSGVRSFPRNWDSSVSERIHKVISENIDSIPRTFRKPKGNSSLRQA